MKDKGFTLIEIIAVVIILGLIILIAVPFFTGSLSVFRNDYYENLTNNVDSAGKEFFADNKLYLPHSTLDASVVKLVDLVNGKYIDEVRDYNGKECDINKSYVVAIRKGRDKYEYTTCLKCSEDDYDNTTDNPYCSSAWLDGFKMTGLRKADTAYVYVGSSKDIVRKKVVAYPSVMRCLKNDLNCTNPVASVTDDDSQPIYPLSIDKVNSNKVGTYPVEYRYENGPIVPGTVVVYQNDSPVVTIEKRNSIHNDTINGGATTTGFVAYDPDTATDWAYDMKLTFNYTFPANSVDSDSRVSRYQIYYHGRWEDYCKSIDDNNQCVKDELREMNEIVKFRYIDNHGNISKETREYNLRVDRTKPTCSLTLSGTPGTDNWYITATEVKFASKADNNGTYPYTGAGNPNSGIKRTVITTSALSNTDHFQHDDTTSVKWYGFVEDYAYNFITCDITFKQDTSIPTCELQFEGTAGSNGWYKKGSNVTISFKSSTDGTSDINSYGFDTTSWTKTATRSESTGSSGVTYTGYVKNGAGLTNTCTKTLYYDKEDPTCDTSKSNLNTTAGVTVSFTCDNNTGGSTTSCPTQKTGVKASDTYTVTDGAGNSNTCSVSVSNKKQQGTGACNDAKTCESNSFGTHKCNCDTCDGACNHWKNGNCNSWTTEAKGISCTEACPSGYSRYSVNGQTGTCGATCCCVRSVCNGWAQVCNGWEQVECNCSQCPNSGRNAAICGCNGYAAGSGWTDNANCSPGQTNTTKTYCRTVYY